MAMFFTESDLHEFEVFVVFSVAARLGIPDPELESLDGVRSEIGRRNPKLAALLDAFLDAYEAWYQFHVRIDAEGKAGNLNASETMELAELVTRRDGTRGKLLHGLRAAS